MQAMTAIPMHKLAGFSDPHAAVEELMRRDFGSFLIRAMPHIQGGAALDYNWHIDAIAYQLERVSKGSCRRLIVNLPPRNLKSIMISVAWVAWRLGNDPMLNFVCVSYSNELSSKHARDCRSIMQSRWYHDLFPGTRINGSRSAAHDFETTAGGGRLATSIGGTLTGRGGDIIIIDDPIKPDDANSDTARDAVNEWFHSTLASRLNDKKRGAIVTVMQRLHQYDLCGMLIETGDWDVLTLPSIAVEDEIIPLTRGRVHARKTGDILHPSREPYAALMAVKQGVGSINFEAQYQQNPVPAEGNMIRAEWLRVYDHLPDHGEIVQSWDTASKDGIHNDYSACVTAIATHQAVYIIDVVRKRAEFPELKRLSIRNAVAHRATALLVEDQASGTQLIQTLRSEAPAGVPRPIPCRPETDKKSRVAGISAMIEAGQVLLPGDAPWLAEFQQELLGFPNARHDDQVDALSQLLDWVRRRWMTYDGPPEPPYVPYVDDDGSYGIEGDEFWEDGDEEYAPLY